MGPAGAWPNIAHRFRSFFPIFFWNLFWTFFLPRVFLDRFPVPCLWEPAPVSFFCTLYLRTTYLTTYIALGSGILIFRLFDSHILSLNFAAFCIYDVSCAVRRSSSFASQAGNTGQNLVFNRFVSLLLFLFSLFTSFPLLCSPVRRLNPLIFAFQLLFVSSHFGAPFWISFFLDSGSLESSLFCSVLGEQRPP